MKQTKNFKYPIYLNKPWNTNILVQKPERLAMPILTLQIKAITHFYFLRKMPNVFLRGLSIYY